MNPKMYRTLVRVEHWDDDHMSVVVPGWTSTVVVDLPWMLLPAKLREAVNECSRFFAVVNLEADDPSKLRFSDWEIP